MAGSEKAEYLAMLAEKDPEIRRLLEEGFEFVTNAFKQGCVPIGVKAKVDQEIVRRFAKEGYQMELGPAFDERGNVRSTMSSIWRKKS